MSASPAQIPLDLGYQPSLTRDDFIVAPCNHIAVHWIDRWPSWPTHTLVLIGPAAAGKSHLARVWGKNAEAVAVTPDKISDRLVSELRGKNLVIDQADLLVGDRASEEVLFHLYNQAKSEKNNLLLTMRAAPFSLPFAVPDLASRLRSSLTVAIDEPDDDLLSAVLAKLFHDRQLDVGDDVLRFLVPRMERSFAAAQRLVAQADHEAMAHHRPITMQLMRQILQSESD